MPLLRSLEVSGKAVPYLIAPNCNHFFPDLYLLTDFKECEGVFL